MLTMNLRKLSKAELAEAVSQHCSQFGSVRDITILHPPERPELAFALVGMTSAGETDVVMNNLGDAKVASLAIIRIEQEEISIPSSVLRSRMQPYGSAQL